MRQVDGVMAADTADGHEDLVMMRIIGDTREGEPARDFLVTDVATKDLHVGFKTMVRLRKVIQEDFPVCCSMCSVMVSLPVGSLQAKR